MKVWKTFRFEADEGTADYADLGRLGACYRTQDCQKGQGMKSALTVSGTLDFPVRCYGCPYRGRAWCRDEEGYPACEREGDEPEEEVEE